YPTVGPLPLLRQSRRRAAPVDQLPGISLEIISTGPPAPAPSRTPLSPSQLPDRGPSLPVTRPSSPLAAIRPASHAVGRTDTPLKPNGVGGFPRGNRTLLCQLYNFPWKRMYPA